MNLLGRTAVALGLAQRQAEGDPSAWAADVTPPARPPAGSTVTVDQALTLESVFRALLLLQTVGQQLTLDAWRRGAPMDRPPALVVSPDANDDQAGWIADSVVSLAARGNVYWRRHRGPSDEVISLEVLNPLDVRPFRDERGRVRYAYKGERLTPYQIAHRRLLRVPGRLEGLGPIQAAASRLSGALDVATYGDRWFRRSGVPSGTLNTDQSLTKDQAKSWKEAWTEQVAAGETAVLGSGLTYKAVYLTPAEAQWLESQRWSVATVARMFGLPPRLLAAAVEGGSDTYSNAQTDDVQFHKYTFAGYTRPIETGLTANLARGQEARFNLDGFLRADTLNRYKAHQIAVGRWLLPEEVRQIERLPELTPEQLDQLQATPAADPAPEETPAP